MSRVTVRDVLGGGGRVASLDRVRQAIGLRWSWIHNGNPAKAGRDLTARLGVSPQTVQTLESRLVGRSETLMRDLRVLGQHDVLAVGRRRLVPPGNDAEADLVCTPGAQARAIIAELRPHFAGNSGPRTQHRRLFDAFPVDLARHRCEIVEEHDFFARGRRVDWLITNLPFSRFRDSPVHAMVITGNVVFLTLLTHFTTHYRIEAITRAGLALRRVMLVPTPESWPSSGFQPAAVWLQRGWRGKSTALSLTMRHA